MAAAIAWLVAAISTAAFLVLWFCVVRKELSAKMNMVSNARLQIIACSKRQTQTTDESESLDAKSILSRSEDIYRQSVALYNQIFKKPQNCIPGFLMGFREIKEDLK